MGRCERSIESPTKTGRKVQKAAKTPASNTRSPAARASNACNNESRLINKRGEGRPGGEGKRNGDVCTIDSAIPSLEADARPVARLCREDASLRYGKINLLVHVPLLRIAMPHIDDMYSIKNHRRLKISYNGEALTIDEIFATLDPDSQIRGKIAIDV